MPAGQPVMRPSRGSERVPAPSPISAALPTAGAPPPRASTSETPAAPPAAPPAAHASTNMHRRGAFTHEHGTGSSSSCSSSEEHHPGRTSPRARRRPLSPAARAAELCVCVSSPEERPDLRALFIQGMGQAFCNDADETWRLLRLMPERKADFYEGAARLMMDRWAHEPVIWHTSCGQAAAVVCTGAQAAMLTSLHDPRYLGAACEIVRCMPLACVPHNLRVAWHVAAAGTAALHGAGVAGRYLKLVVIHTRPEAQGQGLGSALLRGVCATADAQQLPLYLEAAHAGLVPLYQRHGFVVLQHLNAEVDAASPPHLVPLMLRLPGGAKPAAGAGGGCASQAAAAARGSGPGAQQLASTRVLLAWLLVLLVLLVLLGAVGRAAGRSVSLL